jgi:hypothetical protein
MATNRLRELRHNYKAAYTTYMNCVHTLSIASLNGDCLTQTELLADERSFNALTLARRALIDALREHAGASPGD